MSSKLLKKKTKKKSYNVGYIWIWKKEFDIHCDVFCFDTLSETRSACLDKIFSTWFGDITKINRDICYAHLKRRNGKVLRIDFDKVFMDNIKIKE